MTLKIFYDKTTWRGFFPPEKPVKPKDTFCLTFYMIDMQNYEKAYAEAKANALEVGNVEYMIEHTPLGGFEITFIDGIGCTSWPGSAVINDGKYILSI